ncbi:hypothetical protein RM530_03825 [Algiphilus sp. W345]|uniref:Uncharacterized protein n=1 Tax=Banduia mediterranea TaxID=3075609 RepID=A0ABU2WGV4_9GAMM|nr:hypothetical protein [Algiphilus sp. W345]MDT0496494.1 hypothetical protein [Algiphilus sp. W345]
MSIQRIHTSPLVNELIRRGWLDEADLDKAAHPLLSVDHQTGTVTVVEERDDGNGVAIALLMMGSALVGLVAGLVIAWAVMS